MKTPLTQRFHTKKDLTGNPDFSLLVAVGIMLFFGMLFLASASNVFSYKKFGSAYSMVFRQILFGVLPGLVIFFLASKIDYKRYERFHLIFFLASVFLLLLVFIPGFSAEYGTSKSWINVFGFSFQPAELIKLTFLIFLAGWIQKKGYAQVRDFQSGFLPFLMYLVIISYLMVKQPDLGMLMVILFMSVVVYFAAGAKITHLAYLALIGISLLTFMALSKPYIANRIKIFFNPAEYSKSIGYQVDQAFLAIGSGGFFGKGFGKSSQKFSYLPEVSSDSIFAVIAEEMGFFISSLLVLLYLYIVYRGIHIAQTSPDPFGRFLALGIASWISAQAFLNIGVMTGLMPLTGITLPFISAGGSSLVTSLASIGILVNISKHRIE